MQLTAEDEDRRRRRRERNKIAATKCRMKKRERTLNLVTEAEVLESQNIDLKSQVRNLEIERRTLAEMLQTHAPSCLSSDGYQSPVCTVSIDKFMNDIGLGLPGTAANSNNSNGTKATCDHPMKPNKISPVKTSQPQKVQKIPSVNTLKFSCRRSQQQQQHHLQPSSSIECTTASGTSLPTNSTSQCIRTSIHAPNIECKPLPSMDMNYCEGNGDILTQVYCKPIIPTSSDCYAINSPDSGFIKSPVDIGNYANLQVAAIIKSDYIPNCDSGELDHSIGLNGLVVNDNGIEDHNTESTMEFILKSELVDGNDSPYTTVQSADRFLFDGAAEVFDADLDSPTTTVNNLPGGGGHSGMIHNHNDMHHNSLKEHILIHNNNNNNNSNNNNNHHSQNNNKNNINNNNINNNNNNNHSHVVNNNSNINNNSIMIPSSVNSIIEFNNSCQQFVESSLLKGGDFLSHNGEFLALAGDGSDTQFTDLDSGVTTYTTNGSGCLA